MWMKCYIVRVTHTIQTLFDTLDSIHATYYCEEHWCLSQYIEVYVDGIPHKFQEIDKIMKQYS